MGWKSSDIVKLQQQGRVNTTVPVLQYTHAVGIDPGVNTGLAVWDAKGRRLQVVTSCMIHDALQMVYMLSLETAIRVRVEDARKRKWFGKSGREKLQGAGSVKRDCKIWEDFLTDKKILFELVPPKANKTKTTAAQFKALTGWQPRTNEHARDAAMLVYGL